MDARLEDFKGGDVVLLKSGGPKMTVSYVDAHYKVVRCKWFDNGQIREETFYPYCLVGVP